MCFDDEIFAMCQRPEGKRKVFLLCSRKASCTPSKCMHDAVNMYSRRSKVDLAYTALIQILPNGVSQHDEKSRQFYCHSLQAGAPSDSPPTNMQLESQPAGPRAAAAGY